MIMCNVCLLGLQDRHGGLIESQLHIRQVRAADFRNFKIIAENSVATAAQEVNLYRSMIYLPFSLTNVNMHFSSSISIYSRL